MNGARARIARPQGLTATATWCRFAGAYASRRPVPDRPSQSASHGYMKRSASLLFLCLLSGFASADAVEQKTIYGLNEYARILDLNLELPAKLDTGAMTASLSAQQIQRFERDGETWVRFHLPDAGPDSPPIERPLSRISRIKRRAGDFNPDEEAKSYTARPVIELELCLGRTLRTIEVNLTDRSAFQYPLLIGSTALMDFSALVDPSAKYVAGRPACPTPEANPAE